DMLHGVRSFDSSTVGWGLGRSASRRELAPDEIHRIFFAMQHALQLCVFESRENVPKLRTRLVAQRDQVFSRQQRFGSDLFLWNFLQTFPNKVVQLKIAM